MTTEPTEPTEDELFIEAIGDEPDTFPETEVVEDPVEQVETVKAEEPVKAEGDKPTVDDNAPQVPSWRVREINEEKRALAERLIALETERNQWQAERQRLAEQEKTKTEAPARPDPLLDPEGYTKAIRDEIREELLNERRENSLAQAHRTYKGEFEEAYAAAQKHIDPVLKARMQQSRDPGETLMEWHREMKTRAEVGSDLTAYKAKLREEALKDPEFRKQAMEAWRTDARPISSNGRPRIDLSPSLSGVSRSVPKTGDSDISDEQLFKEITG